MGEGGGGEEKGRFLFFSSLPFSLPFFPLSPETPDTQAITYPDSSLRSMIATETLLLLNGHVICRR